MKGEQESVSRKYKILVSGIYLLIYFQDIDTGLAVLYIKSCLY